MFSFKGKMHSVANYRPASRCCSLIFNPFLFNILFVLVGGACRECVHICIFSAETN